MSISGLKQHCTFMCSKNMLCRPQRVVYPCFSIVKTVSQSLIWHITIPCAVVVCAQADGSIHCRETYQHGNSADRDQDIVQERPAQRKVWSPWHVGNYRPDNLLMHSTRNLTITSSECMNQTECTASSKLSPAICSKGSTRRILQQLLYCTWNIGTGCVRLKSPEVINLPHHSSETSFVSPKSVFLWFLHRCSSCPIPGQDSFWRLPAVLWESEESAADSRVKVISD